MVSLRALQCIYLSNCLCYFKKPNFERGTKMKRLFVMLMVLVMSLLVASCAAEAPVAEPAAPAAVDQAPAAQAPAAQDADEQDAVEQGSERMVIGMSAFNLTDPGLILIQNGAELAAQDFNAELVWSASEGNMDVQIDQIRAFIQMGVDAIWIDSVDVVGVIGVVNEATEAGIIVLTAGSRVEAIANYNLIYPDYVDAYFAASLIGEYFRDQEGTIGLVVGSAGNLVSEGRQAGFTDGLARFPNLNLVTGMGMWDATTSMTVAEDMARANPDLLHVHVIADGMSFGVRQGIQNVGVDISLSSNDGDPDALDLLETGEFLFNNVVGNERLGYWGIAIARRLFDGESMARDQFLPTYKVMTDEMFEFVQERGLTVINNTEFDFVTIPEARRVVGSDYYRREFDASFVPTQ